MKPDRRAIMKGGAAAIFSAFIPAHLQEFSLGKEGAYFFDFTNPGTKWTPVGNGWQHGVQQAGKYFYSLYLKRQDGGALAITEQGLYLDKEVGEVTVQFPTVTFDPNA